MTPENTDKYKKVNAIRGNNFTQELEKNLGRAKNARVGASVSRSVVGPLSAAIEIIPAFEKYSKANPTAELGEIALSPEGSQALAKGVSAALGSEIGGGMGASLPVPASAKPATALAGAILGAVAGSKLGELLTGNEKIDKIIKAAYNNQLQKRELQMIEEANE